MPAPCFALKSAAASRNCINWKTASEARVIMARHGFGRGEYRYFSYPLPVIVQNLRTLLYSRLRSIANRWNELMGLAMRYPEEHAAYLARCHAAGQSQPTPLFCVRAHYRCGTRLHIASCIKDSLRQGDLAIFAVRDRPAKGVRGIYRVKHRHGVSRVHTGRRQMLGVIFHDAS